MKPLTPAEFAHKMQKTVVAVREQDSRAIQARAKVTKEIIEATAAGTSGLGRKWALKGWVKIKHAGGDEATVQLHQGFGYLAELGSYKKPDGYIERPKKVTARRRNAAAKRGQTINESGLLSTPYGVFPFVHHPRQRAHPFWRAGVEKSRKPGYDAYSKSIVNTIHKAVR